MQGSFTLEITYELYATAESFTLCTGVFIIRGVINVDIFLAISLAPGSLFGTAKDAIGFVDSKSIIATTFSLELMSIPAKRVERRSAFFKVNPTFPANDVRCVKDYPDLNR